MKASTSSGDDVSEAAISKYEQIRDEIVRNRRKELQKMGFFSELDKAKNDVKVQPQKKRKTLGDASNKPEVLRRSGRDRRQVDYTCGDDVEFVPPRKPWGDNTYQH